jgi:hypothetical protein
VIMQTIDTMATMQEAVQELKLAQAAYDAATVASPYSYRDEYCAKAHLDAVSWKLSQMTQAGSVQLLRAAADDEGLIPTKKVRELLGDDRRSVVVGMLAADEAEFVRNERGGWCSILRLKAVPARGRAA